MKEKPILFSSDMVNAILEGRKTQTRRVIKNACDIVQNWDKKDPTYGPFFENKYGEWEEILNVCPYGFSGYQLWVRESFSYGGFSDKRNKVVISYKADNSAQYKESNNTIIYDRYKEWSLAVIERAKRGRVKVPIDPLRNMPSIFMPRWASRINLKVVNVRVERLQDISEEDAEKEGINFLRNIPDADESLTAKELFLCFLECAQFI